MTEQLQGRFLDAVRQVQAQIHENAVAKGWYEVETSAAEKQT